MRKYILYAAVLSLFTIQVHAQNSWTSILVLDPSPSPYFNDWERDPSIGTMLVNTPAGTPETEFYCKLELYLPSYKSGTPIIEGESSSLRIPPGPQSQVYRYADIVDWKDVDYDKSLYETILRSGRLLEGEYEIKVIIYPYPKRSNAQPLTECSGFFSISYPNPPELIAPENQAVLTEPYPVFMWSPVVMPPGYTIKYHLKMVERINLTAAPERELEANSVHYEGDIEGQTTFAYPPDALPLESGKEYIWQITATDENGNAPSQNNGKSEVFTFNYGVKKVMNKPVALEQLMIEENFAYLKDVRSLEMTEDPLLDQYILNGSGSLELRFGGLQPILISANIEELKFQKDYYTPPNFSSGSIKANLFPGDIPESVTGPYFQPQDIEYNPLTGLTIGGILNLPGSTGYSLNTRFNLRDGQISGTGSASGLPLFVIGDDKVKLLINEAELHFSTPVVTLRGEVQVFGEVLNCTIPDIVLNSNSSIDVRINCSSPVDVDLLTGSADLHLKLNRIEGTCTFDLTSGSLNYDLNTEGALDLTSGNIFALGADIGLNLTPPSMDIEYFRPRGSLGIPPIDLGLFKLQLSNLALEQFSFAGGMWDFNISSDMSFEFPAFGGSSLGQGSRVNFTKNGLAFPDINLSAPDLPKVNFDFINLAINGLRIPSVNLDWASLSSGSFAGLNIGFDMNMGFSRLPGNFSDEFKNLIIPLNNISFLNGSLNIPLPDLTFPGYDVGLGGGINFTITGLSGNLSGELSGGNFSLIPSVFLKGKISLPAAFTCTGTNQIDISREGLKLSGNGRLTGTIQNVIPNCPLELYNLRMSVTQSDLKFIDASAQQVIFDGTGNLVLSNIQGININAEVNFSYDIINNRVISLTGSINTPFVLNIPAENPSLKFVINSALLSNQLLTIDGRNAVLLGDGTSVNATFNNVRFDLSAYNISAGSITLDVPFALKGSVNNQRVSFSTTNINTQIFEENSILLKLPETITIGTTGIGISGTGSAHLRIQGCNLQNLGASFSNNFALSFDPFKITSGQCEILHGASRIVMINSNGFFPNMNFLAQTILPDKLPLISDQIAFVQIKENSNLMLDQSFVDGNIRLRTRPGQALRMVFPALQFNRPLPPEVLVNFDITVDQVEYDLVEGSISVVIPEGSRDDFDLSAAGIPFQIRQFSFGKHENNTTFTLKGNAKLFGNTINENEQQTLYLRHGGILSGELRYNLNQVIALIPGTDKLNLQLTSLSGNVEVGLLPLNLDYNFKALGKLQLKHSTGIYNAELTLGITPSEGMEIENFRAENPAQPIKLSMDWLELQLSDLKLNALMYTHNPGFNFELSCSVELNIPALNLRCPKLRNITLTKNGFSLPELSITQISRDFYNLDGLFIKPRNLRHQGAFTIDWFNFTGSLGDIGLKLDLEMKIPWLPGNASPALKSKSLFIQNAGIVNGYLSGDISPVNLGTGCSLPLGSGIAFYPLSMSGGLSSNGQRQNVNLMVKGNISLPEVFGCAKNSILNISTAAINYINGKLSGLVAGEQPGCSFNLGIGSFTVNSDTLNFSFENENQKCTIICNGELRIPGTTPNSFVSGTGRLMFDLFSGEIIDGAVRVSQEFKVQFPKQNPVLAFTVSNGLLDKNGFTINGAAVLKLSEGTASANFNNLCMDPFRSVIKSGRIELSNNFAFRITVNNGLNWAAVPLNYNLVENTGLKLTLPQTIVFDSKGIALNGRSSVEFKWLGTRYPEKSCIYDNLLIGLSRFGITNGRAAIMNSGTDTLAIVDQNGITPKSLLDVNLPAQIPLPDLATAYLQIKDANNALLVRFEKVPGGVKLNTSNPVKFYIPALANGGNVQSYDVSLTDVVVSEPAGGLVSGSIQCNIPGGLSLVNTGIPLKLKKFLYEKTNNNYVLKTFADLYLPRSLDSLKTEITARIESTGLTQIIAGAGTYKEQTGGPYLKSFIIPNINTSINLQGLQFDFSAENRVFKLSGDLLSSLFSRQQTSSPVHFTAEWNNNQYRFNLIAAQGTSLPLGAANFAVTRSSFTVSEQNFNISIGGVLTFTNYNNLAITLDPITITNTGIDFSAIRLSTEQTFRIFGADFILKNMGGNNALTLSYTNNVLFVTLCGEVSFLGKRINFTNLRVGTDGTMTIAGGAAFINGPVEIITNYLTLKRFELEGSPLKLKVTGEAKLPAPAADFIKEFNFRIAFNGEVDGGAVVPILNPEASRLDNNSSVDPSEYNLNFAVFDPTYVNLNLNFNNISSSALRLSADLYLTKNIGESQSKKISFGRANPFEAGLEIRFDGVKRWNVSGSYDIDSIKWEMLTLNDMRVSVEGDGRNFALALSGKISLNLPGITGGLDFNNIRLTSEGKLENLTRSIQTGTLSLFEAASISVNRIEYSNTPTTLDISGGSMPTTGNPRGNTTAPPAINVQSYFTFGGQFSIAGVASGGVDKFLLYKTTAGATGLVIQDANLQIQDLLTFNADFSYQSLVGGGYNFLLGGTGKLLNTYEMTVVGKLGRNSRGTTFGLYVAGDIPRITIPPCIFLEGLGGGFFLNPEKGDLDLITSLAAVDGTISSKITDPGGFAVLLFAKAVIAAEELVEGRALLTITENYLTLDAKFKLLNQENINGLAHLAIGFTDAFAEGDIKVTVAIEDFITGDGNLNFFVYGRNDWGIIGDVDIDVFGRLNSTSNFYVGSEGLLVSLSVKTGFDIWIIEVESGIEGSIFLTDENWGAFCKAYIYVEVLDGLATAKGWLQTVLLVRPKFILSGLAGLAVSVGPFDWDGTVWATLSSDGFDGGFGYDSEIAKLVKTAKNTASEMNNAANEAKAAIDAAVMDRMRFSENDLAAAFLAMRGLGQLYRYGTPAERTAAGQELEAFVNSERDDYNYDGVTNEFRNRMTEEHSLFLSIKNSILASQDLPPTLDVNAVKVKREELDALIQQHNTRRTEVAARFDEAAGNSQISELSQRNFNLPGTPVTNQNFSAPQSVTSIGPDGKRTKSIINKPGFVLDMSKAEQNTNSVNQANADVASFEQEIKSRITVLESGLNLLNEALKGSGNQVSHLKIGSEYWLLLNKLDQFYKDLAAYYYNESQWSINKRASLAQKQNEIRTKITAKTERFSTNMNIIQRMTQRRVDIIRHFNPEATGGEFNNWNSLNNAAKLRVCTQIGLDLWYNTLMLGMRKIDSLSRSRLWELWDNKEIEMNSINAAQAAYTKSVDAIYDKKILLTENLFDIYSRYKFWKESQPENVRSEPITLADITRKRNSLLNELKVPVITAINVRALNAHTYNYQEINWSGTAPTSPLEFSVKFDGTGMGSTYDFLSIGDHNFLYRWILRAGTVTRQTGSITVRGRYGAGFTNARTNNFTIEFSEQDTPQLTSQMVADNSRPPAPVVELPNLRHKSFPSGRKYYSSDPNRLLGIWNTSDEESGIVEYQYQIISIPTTTVLNWTSAAGMNSVLIEGLNLRNGTTYRLRAKALNGQGLWSELGRSGELIVDTTPPTVPGAKFLSPFIFFPLSTPPPPVIPPVPLPDELQDGSAPRRELMDLPISNPAAQRPSLEVSWNASSDAESGVTEYKYKVISVSDPSIQSDSLISVGTNLQTTITKGKFSPLSFLDSYYVEVYALNFLDLISEPLRIGPLRPADQTPPTTPAAAVSHGPVNGSAFLIFREESVDWETSIKGYQVAIGTTAGGTNMKSWNDIVDFTPADINGARAWFIPDYNLPDGKYYISLRAKNKQDMVSNICITGPYTVDQTPPVRPRVTAVKSGSNLSISVTNVSDPQSDITKVEYSIGSTARKQDIVSWTSIPLRRTSFSIPFSDLGFQPNTTYYINARTINYVGLTSETASTSFTLVVTGGGK